MVNITTTSNTFLERQQKTRQGSHVSVIEIEVAIEALDRHIERLEAKLSFLIRSYDNDPCTSLSNQYEKKIATIKQEIDDTMEHRRELTRRRLAAASFSMRNMIVEDEKYWQNELSSLGIECKRTNELNDKEELEALATAIKEVYFEDYKTAYDDSYIRIGKLHFEPYHY
jgi:hypothetical protein